VESSVVSFVSSGLLVSQNHRTLLEFPPLYRRLHWTQDLDRDGHKWPSEEFPTWLGCSAPFLSPDAQEILWPKVTHKTPGFTLQPISLFKGYYSVWLILQS